MSEVVIIRHKKQGVVAVMNKVPHVQGQAYLRLYLYSQGLQPHNPDTVNQYDCSEAPITDTVACLAAVVPTTFLNDGHL